MLRRQKNLTKIKNFDIINLEKMKKKISKDLTEQNSCAIIKKKKKERKRK